ncbi:hypothetical protein VTO73DRAFT_9788 [Trametes versicolor]
MSFVFPRTDLSGFLGLFTNNLVWPTCPASLTSFQPLFNHRGQDPCTIALNLLKPCDAIPEWAYLPLGADGKVDLTQAREAASQNEPDMTSPGSYISPLQSAGGASPVPTFAPTSDSTAPRPGSFTVATPTASSALSEAAVPVPSPTSTAILAISSVPATITHSEIITPTSASSPTQETESHPSASNSVLQGAASFVPSSTVVTLHSISPQSTPQNQIAKSRNLAPIFGGVLGGIAVAVLAAYLATRLIRRRRREKEAAFASGSLDWWRRPNGDLHHAGREFAEGSTVKAETDLDDLETLHCAMSVEKKSVTYGEYPDP